MTDPVLAAITERAAKATPGPWNWDGTHAIERTGTYEMVYEATHDHGCACRKLCQMDVELSEANADFIANSRADVAFLLARVGELEAQLRWFQDQGFAVRGLAGHKEDK